MSSHQINGLDEAGRIGDNIIFTKVSLNRENEINLLIYNLLSFNKIILNKSDIKGHEPPRLFKYIKALHDDETINVSHYIMRHRTQNLLLSSLFRFVADDLFRSRGDLISLFEERDWSIIQRALNILNRFKKKNIFAESYVKSFGFKKIAEQIGRVLLRKHGIDELSKRDSPRTVIQIDGGYPFSFWWYDLMQNPESGLISGKALITGITNGDNFYPTVSSAGTISGIMSSHPERRYLYPLRELEIYRSQFEDENISSFSYKHSKSLEKPIYQNRILKIGSITNELWSTIPYLKHLKEDRKKTYEVFTIHTENDISDFFREWGYGKPENTNIIVGTLATTRERENVSWCIKERYPVEYTTDYKDDFDTLISNLSARVDIAHPDIRNDYYRKIGNFERRCRRSL